MMELENMTAPELQALVKRQETELTAARQALDGAVEINNGYLREIDALKAERAAKAQVALTDEREEFERVERSNSSNMKRQKDGQYENPCTQSAWEGWQARAALAPSIQALPVVAQPWSDEDWDTVIYGPRSLLKAGDWNPATKRPFAKPALAAAQPEAKEASAALTKVITDLADDFDCGRNAKGNRLFSDRNLESFAVALLAAAGNSQDAKDAEEQAQGEGWLRAMSDISALLPSTYYMDPPDGGSVPVMEQVRRMANDSARYRWLRNNSAGQWKHPIVVEQMRAMDRMQYIGPLTYEALDTAIDAAMAAAPSPAEDV